MGMMGFGMSTVLALAGCASTGNGKAETAAAAALPSTQAVACSKCEVTYVKVPTNDAKGRFIGYSTRKNMECPDCKTAVQTFFETGKLEHSCAHCQGTMEVCESH
jgi:hypothetical protein